MVRRYVPFLLAASLGSALLAGCGSTTPSSAAQKPTKLVLYSAQGYDQAEATAFQKATGIKVELTDMSTGDLLAKLQAEGSHPKWDVVWFDGNGAMAALDAQGELLRGFTPANAKYYTALGKSLLPKDHAWFPGGVTAAAAIAYNKKSVPTADVPTSWTQLLSPQFKGSVGMNNPAISGPTYPFVAEIFKIMGVSQGQQFFKQLKQNGLHIYPTNGNTLQALQSGALKVAMFQDSAILSAMQQDPNIGISYPTEGVAMLPDDMAISSKAPDLEAAKMFVNFVLSQKGQQVQTTQGGGDSLYQPVVTDATENPSRPNVSIKWITVDPIWAGNHESALVQWFTDNVVQ
ncbi:MAG: extracellular solute-binding protein [Thermaerobacter sp.]|nr:extracellular solute-binding protein [Thermaerobacter sp.]